MQSVKIRIRDLIPVVIITWLSTSVESAPYRLPDFGSSVDMLLSAAEQRQLDRAFMHSVRTTLPVSDDAIVNDYLRQVGRSLTTQKNTTYDFFLIDQAVINAFAGPGGHIGVFAGLLLATDTEDELAAVLAHEIAHVDQKHLLRAVEAQQRLTVPMTALLITAAILGAQVDSTIGAAAITGIQAGALQQQLNFTREHEYEADHLGIALLAAAGYDPYAMPGFFQRLTKSQQFYDNSAPVLLRTHPVNAKRIADGLARAEHFTHRQRPNTLSFHLIRARLRYQQQQHIQNAVQYFAATLKSGRYHHAAAERYGYVLALIHAGQFATAQREIAPLLADYPQQIEFVLLKAELDQQTGAVATALSELKMAVARTPNSWALAEALAAVQIRMGQPAAALTTLEQLQRVRPDVTAAYSLMADAAGRAGQVLKTYRYRAEQLYYQGDVKAAVQQLELALRHPDMTPYLAERLQVRLQELTTLLAEQRTDTFQRAP